MKRSHLARKVRWERVDGGKAKEVGVGEEGGALQGAHRGGAQAPGRGRQPGLNSVFLGGEHGWIPLIVLTLCASYSVMGL